MWLYWCDIETSTSKSPTFRAITEGIELPLKNALTLPFISAQNSLFFTFNK